MSRDQRIFNFFIKWITLSSLAFSSYIFILSGVESYSGIGSKRIKDKQHLEQLVEEEIKRMGIENKKISVYIKEGGGICYSKKIEKDTYEIILSENYLNLTTLRHELYHIADGHCDALIEMPISKRQFMYLFWYEPKAVLYELRQSE